jgi:hypothetical protein
MPRTPDPIGDGLELPDAGFDPPNVGDIYRNGTDIKAKDGAGVFNLRSGTGLSEAAHRTLRQLIHFIDEGPAEGFASGAFRATTGTVFPTAIVWWTSSGMTSKIVEKLLTYTGAFATTIQWKMYDVDGSTVLAIVTDVITLSGSFETSRTRTIA